MFSVIVSRIYIVRNEGAQKSWNRKGVGEESGSVELRKFGHVERMNEYRIARRLLMAGTG